MRITVYIPESLVAKLRKDKTLWSNRQLYLLESNGEEPPIGSLLVEAAARDQRRK